MSVKYYTIEKIPYSDCVKFCSEWHYSKTCPAGKEYFGLFDGARLIGIACYGYPAMRNQIKCYGVDIELRRLCCIDDTPKNTESYFIGNTLKKLRKIGYKSCISLADPKFGHSGTIYRASNFKYMGVERGGGSMDIVIDGETMHSKTAFTRFGASGLKRLSELFPDKSIQVINKERKHVYVYNL